MKKNKMVQITATLALFAIIVWIIGTGILILTTDTQTQNIELTQEQIQELINAQSGSIDIDNEGVPVIIDENETIALPIEDQE